MKIKPNLEESIKVLEYLREEYHSETPLHKVMDYELEKYNNEQNGEK